MMLRFSLFLLAFVLALPSARADSDLATPGLATVVSMLPQDTELVVVADDLPALMKTLPEHPLAKWWNNASMDRPFANLHRVTNIERWDRRASRVLGYSLDDLLATLSGPSVLVLSDLHALMNEQGNGPRATLIAGVGDEVEPLEALLGHYLDGLREDASAAEQIVDETYDISGVPVQVIERVDAEASTPVMAWTLTDGYLLLSRDVEHMHALIAALQQDEAEPAWEGAGVFREIAMDRSGGELLVYLDTRVVPDLVTRYLSNQYQVFAEAVREDDAASDEAGSDAMAEWVAETREQLRTGLRLDNLQGLYLAVDLDPAHSDLHIGLRYREDVGLTRLLASRPGPLALPDWMPGDAYTVGLSRSSIPQLWSAVKEMGDYLPIAGEIVVPLQAALSEIADQTGFDVERSVLDALSEEGITLTLPGDDGGTEAIDGPGQQAAAGAEVGLVGINDRQSIEMALEAIKSYTGTAELFEVNDFLGTLVYSHRSAPISDELSDWTELSHAVTDDYLVYSTDPSALRRTLTLMNQGDGGTAPFDPESPRDRAMQALADGASELNYSIGEPWLRGVVEWLEYAEQMAEGPRDYCGPVVTTDQVRLRGVLGGVVEAGYKSDQEFRYQIRALHPGERRD